MKLLVKNFYIFILVCASCVPPNNVKFEGRVNPRTRSNISYRKSHYSKFNKSKRYTRKRIIRLAQINIGVPYRYGGNTPAGFDCSGLVNYIYKKNGYIIPRTAELLFYNGTRILFRRAKPGDLLFFNTGKKIISHVAIYIGNYKFIHAPSTGKRVRIDSIKKKYWKKRYIGTVRYI